MTAIQTPVYTPEFVERGYNNRAAVPEHPVWLERWTATSRDVIAAFAPRRDVRYGRGVQETLDLYLPSGTPCGTLMFIHGGWWRALDKSDHAFVVPPFLAQGMAVAVVNYDLCPQASIGEISAEMRRALAFLVREAPRLGIPAAPLVVAGHSAGGHLTAMLHATPAADLGLPAHPVHGAVSLSGVHDLTPLVHFSLNSDFRLDDVRARELSPVHMQARSDAPLLLAVGADETGEFVRQTDLLWHAWPGNRPRGASGPMRIADRHHYSVVFDYADPHSALTRGTLALFQR
jgi:arylformamidase